MTEATPTQCYPRQSDVRGMGSDPNADSTASHATLPNRRRINFESQQIRKERTFYHAVTYDDIDKGNGPSVELQNLTKKVSTRSANGGVFNHLPILYRWVSATVLDEPGAGQCMCPRTVAFYGWKIIQLYHSSSIVHRSVYGLFNESTKELLINTVLFCITCLFVQRIRLIGGFSAQRSNQ